MERIRRWSLGLAVALFVACAIGAVAPSLAESGDAAGSSIPVPRVLSHVWTVAGDLGGTLHYGRWTILVPAGAFSGSGTVTLTVSERNVYLCDLNIQPANLNGFRHPVQLVFSTQGLPVDPSTMTIYWYDSVAKQWVDVHGTGDSRRLVVTVNLQHFSTYRAGKAGW